MSSHKALLRKSDLAEFIGFCASGGWQEVSRNGVYEVLRMRKRNAKHPLIVYRRDKPTEFLTVTGASLTMALAFKERQKHEKAKYQELQIKQLRPRPVRRFDDGRVHTAMPSRGGCDCRNSRLNVVVLGFLTTIRRWFSRA